MAIYANCLIYIFMNSNINILNEEKIAKKIRVYIQNYRYLASNCPRVAIIILNLSLCITLLLCGKILESSNLYEININENFKITRKKMLTN